MNVFERAFIRAGIDVNYTTGFNPKPKLEFANPITLGFESEDEIASIEILSDKKTDRDFFENDFIAKINNTLPAGIKVLKSKIIKTIICEETGKKVPSLMSTYGGGIYELKCVNNSCADKLFKRLKNEDGVSIRINSENRNILNLRTEKKTNGKILNIFRFLKDEYGIEHPFDYFEVTRKHTLCSGTTETHEQDNYFQCYE